MRKLLLALLFGCGADVSDVFGVYTRGWLRGEVYDVPPGSERIPDFAELPMRDVIYADALDVRPGQYTRGFAGGRFEWFAIRYKGTFNALASGEHRFHVRSDDGAIVYIDDQRVLDNDGRHPPTDASATLYLPAGVHSIQVDYFQAARYEAALQLWVAPPGGAERLAGVSF